MIYASSLSHGPDAVDNLLSSPSALPSLRKKERNDVSLRVLVFKAEPPLLL